MDEQVLQVGKTRYTHSTIASHLVWIPKDRRRVLTGEAQQETKRFIADCCEQHGLTLLGLSMDADHLHVAVGAPPWLSPAMSADVRKAATPRVSCGKSSLISRKSVERSSCGLRAMLLGQLERSEPKRSNATLQSIKASSATLGRFHPAPTLIISVVRKERCVMLHQRPNVDTSVPQIEVPDQFNVATAFLDRNVEEGRGSKIAVYHEGISYTYAQLAELANRIGNGLLDLAVDMEQRVALLLFDSPQFASAFFGAIKIGAVPVPLNSVLRPDDYVYMLNDSRARVLLVHAPLWQNIQQILPQLKYLRHVVIVGRKEQTTGHLQGIPLHDFDRWVSRTSSTLVAAETHKDDCAFWLYSSGSTGFPKGCVHLQHDMVYCTEYYARPILGITENDITFSAAKLYFAYGLGNNLYFPFSVGASAVYHSGRPLAEDMFKVVEQYRPTIFYGIPTLYASMLALHDEGKHFDFSSVRICTSAGEALPADILRRWKQAFNVDILDGIGSTEILHIFISNRVGDIKPGSTGKLVPGYAAMITDEGGQPVKQGDIGNLLISGDSIAACYWNKHEKTKSTINGYWIHTGDKYFQDEEGYYWYCGRSDDMLKVGGQWVSPVEVENMLIMHPTVLEAAVVGVLDDEKLVKPKAFVTLKPGYSPSDALAEELKNFVKDRLAPFKYPRYVEFMPELPKTATGKIQRFILRGTGRTEPLNPDILKLL